MKFIRFSLSAAAILTSIPSCGIATRPVGGDLPLPVEWQNAAGFPLTSMSRDLSKWWRRFEDPTLSRIISDALASSPDMAIAAARISEARAQRTGSVASLLPSLTGSATRNSSVSSESDKTSDSVSLSANWEADLFGKNASAVEAASAQFAASRENFRSVQTVLAAEIAIAYTDLRVSETSLTVLRETLKSREKTHQLAEWRTQAGEADLLESSQALSSLEQARAGIPALQQSIAQGRNRLALLAGKTPGALDGLLDSGQKTIPSPARSLAVGIPADTLRQRPDVRQAGYQLLAAAANSRGAEAARYPSLKLGGALGLNTLNLGKLTNPGAAVASIFAGITSPVFDAGSISAKIRAQNAVEEQAYQVYRKTVLTALSEVEDALIACRRTSERFVILEKAIAAAREADSLARQKYQAGVADLLTVLDSQRTLLGLEDSLANVRASRTVAYIQLYKALGGGWS
jgi:outer membrane protein, multidrug efflux system